MERQSLGNPEIISVGYDKSSQVMEVEFHGRRIYRYSDVPEIVYERLVDHEPDPVKYLNENIRDVYAYSRIK